MTKEPVIQPAFSAIICTYDRYDELAGAIGALRAQTIAAALEIIVVDNSPDQTAAARFGARYADVPRLRYVLQAAPGLSRARNTAAGLAQAPILGFLDDDAIASPGWAAALLDGFAALRGQGVGAAGGPARPLWRGERPAWLADRLLGHLSILDHGPKLRLLPADQYVVGCNMAFDRRLLLDIGGFSARLGRVGPETALLSNGEPGVLDAVRAAGRGVGYVPAAAVDHCIDPSRLSQTWFRRRAAWQAVSDYLMDSTAMANYAPNATHYLKLVEAGGNRGLGVGFFAPARDGDEFAADLRLIRELVIATLSGGAEAAPGARPVFTRPTAAAVLRLRQQLQKSPAIAASVRRLRRRYRALRDALANRA